MTNNTYKFTFPFTGQVKTQLIISKNRLVKPKNVKRFEDAVRLCLAEAFPMEERPIKGYLKFELVHYTQYRRNKDGLIEQVKKSDLDNIMKTIADVFQPLYKNVPKVDEHGQLLFTDKGNPRYTKVEVSPGVIQDDQYIVRAGLYWIPVEEKTQERIEVYITPISEEELFSPPVFKAEDVIELS